MIKIDNVALLKNKFSEVWSYYAASEGMLKREHINLKTAKNGLPTLSVMFEGNETFLHSKYDPIHESEQWLAEYEERVHEYEHVFFYGVGFGYHIETLMKKYSNKSFSIYEPDASVFYEYISNRNLSELPLKSLKRIMIEYVPSVLWLEIDRFLSAFNDKVLIITHPIYSRVYAEQTNRFQEYFTKAIEQKRTHLASTSSYEKLWTVNSMHNFIKVLETPNILRDMKGFFKDKPVLMVAAGPSLEEEFEHIKYIKENRLAYIIAIGSANKALLSQGIFPDAVTSYDPNIYNHLTYEEIITQKLSNIPMIFGTSVGYKTVELYPGPMLHMVTIQDPVSVYYLQEERLLENGEFVTDAPSIAVITLELLHKLECNLLIMVGQNFAFKNNQYYSTGVNYTYRTNELSDSENADMEMVESVDGGEVQTMKGHSVGRIQMEQYLSRMTNIKVVNTTKNGAKIQGTEFITLEQIIETELKEQVVDPQWYMTTPNPYNLDKLSHQVENMEKSRQELRELFEQLAKTLQKMETLVTYNEATQLKKMFPKLDKITKKFLANDFYKVFLSPALRLAREQLNNSIIPIREIADMVEKARKTKNVFGQYVYDCQNMFQTLENMVMNVQQYIRMTIDERRAEENNDANPADTVLAE
ncbi:motility associated factor glycosyltransferase family protein [Paenibacillus agricola]|uniref:Motility associated factor glycosyltransferase family protein n=1 Tax=Paenibacillus agricola TaxID=2716264 RepID=A0ABX0JF41_9BACL|nr:6-hydroxymethylpterin diphosphokinase MptE-like protein [Paenibacillus agricola]NHN33874.1 motility associated factor glycosyltransferase family protein [Paenibacillus agricola]